MMKLAVGDDPSTFVAVIKDNNDAGVNSAAPAWAVLLFSITVLLLCEAIGLSESHISTSLEFKKCVAAYFVLSMLVVGLCMFKSDLF